MFDQLVDLVSHASAWAYVAIALVAAVDALIPLVPSETAVITAGVLASTGELGVGAVLACAAAGAMLGDNAAYALGRRYHTRAARRGRSLVSTDRLRWAERRLAARSAELIVAARFVPGGRTAVMVTAGGVAFPWRRFVALDAAAAVIWSGYATGLGFFGGEAFAHRPWHGLLFALALAFCATAAIECLRWVRRRKRRLG